MDVVLINGCSQAWERQAFFFKSRHGVVKKVGSTTLHPIISISSLKKLCGVLEAPPYIQWTSGVFLCSGFKMV